MNHSWFIKILKYVIFSLQESVKTITRNIIFEFWVFWRFEMVFCSPFWRKPCKRKYETVCDEKLMFSCFREDYVSIPCIIGVSHVFHAGCSAWLFTIADWNCLEAVCVIKLVLHSTNFGTFQKILTLWFLSKQRKSKKWTFSKINNVNSSSIFA